MITPLGTVLVAIALALAFTPRRHLLWMTIASAPVFFAAVIDVSGTWIRPVHLFGGLLVVRGLLATVCRRSTGMQEPTNRRRSPVDAIAWAFVAAVVVSLTMPWLYEGRVDVVALDTSYRDYTVEPLRPSPRNFTQAVYPLFGVLVLFALIRELRTVDRLLSAYWLVARLGAVVALSGLAFQIAWLRGADRVVEAWFKITTGTSDLSTIIGRADNVDALDALPRAFSLAGEPGFTSAFLIVSLAFAAGLYVGRTHCRVARPGLAPGVFLGTVSLLALLVSGATTGYLGVALLLATAFFVPLTHRVNTVSVRPVRVYVGVLLAMTLLLLVTTVAATSFGFSMISYVQENHIPKLTGEAGSGIARMNTVGYSMQEVFPVSPLLGVGFGSHRTASLAVSLLTNVGLLGFGAFIALNLVILRRVFVAYRWSRDPSIQMIAFGGVLAFIAVFPLLLFAKGVVVLQFGWYWLLMAIMEATARLHFNQRQVARFPLNPAHDTRSRPGMQSRNSVS